MRRNEVRFATRHRLRSVSYTHLDVYKRQAQIYTDIIRSGKHLLAEKPFGIDLPACQSILTAMREHPQVFVRCSSEFPYYPAAQQLFRWYQEGFFGRVIEARFTIKHASDMDLGKPINWKQMCIRDRAAPARARSARRRARPWSPPRLRPIRNFPKTIM